MKTVIITGANSGLGFETAKKIAGYSIDFEIILACRNIQKAQNAKEQIIEETGNQNIIAMQLDTSSNDSVRKFVEDYKKHHNKHFSYLVKN